MRHVPTAAWAATALAALLAGCAHVEHTPLPALPQADAFSTAPAGGAGDAAAALQPDRWWTLYQDPALDTLQQRLLQDSPDLAGALARYRQAQALTDTLRAAQRPSIGTSLDLARNRQSDRRPLRGATSPDEYSSMTLGLGLQYEVDLWGRVEQTVRAGQAREGAAQADLAAAQLALQAQLADTVLALRGTDQQIALLGETETALVRAASMMAERQRAGLASGLDLAQAEAQREAAKSQRQQAQAQRAVLEHAAAALVGAHASSFTLAPTPASGVLPDIPVGLPSGLLTRRPDIAAARLRAQAASASVGVARTAFFPSLTLNAGTGWQSDDLARFIAAPNIFWVLGSGLAANLFDGGRREAELVRARALLDEAGQSYRQVVLGAFQQVEDQLTLLQGYGEAAASEQKALAAAQRALQMATTRYRDGAASYLDVITAQAEALRAQRSAVELQTRQRRASVQLVRALGGGWADGTVGVGALASAERAQPR